MPAVMLPDVIDADELTHGNRREGLLTAFFVFLNKVSIGIVIALSGYVLGAGGYDNSAGEPPPSPELERTVRFLCGLLPCLIAVLILPFIYFYPMTATAQRRLNERVVAERQRLQAGSSEGAALLGDDSKNANADEPGQQDAIPLYVTET